MATDRTAHDVWAVGAAYERYVGRWSRAVAGAFVRWVGARRGGRWLDVGCGAGALTHAICDAADPSSVLGVDRSEGFVRHARTTSCDPRARFAVGDAAALPVPDAALDAVGSGLVLNFVPAPPRMVSEMARVARPGGAVALYVWDYAEGMELMRRFWDAAIALEPAAAALDEGARFPVCAPGPLTALLEGAGLADVEARAIDVSTPFRDFDDFWSPFLGGQGPAPGYAASLPPDRRDALRERVRQDLPVAPDGSIPLQARAWAVRGTRPGRVARRGGAQ